MKTKKLAVIVDDNPIILDLLKATISPLDYEVKAYRSPLRIPCISTPVKKHFLIDGNIPDLLITDIKMPGMDGLELIFQIKSRGNEIGKIGIISGFWDDELREMATLLECKIFEKPFSLDELKKWIEE